MYRDERRGGWIVKHILMTTAFAVLLLAVYTAVLVFLPTLAEVLGNMAVGVVCANLAIWLTNQLLGGI